MVRRLAEYLPNAVAVVRVFVGEVGRGQRAGVSVEQHVSTAFNVRAEETVKLQSLVHLNSTLSVNSKLTAESETSPRKSKEMLLGNRVNRTKVVRERML